ncbi:major facilitator superfamily transporter [Xylariaceae sp. FL0804]|nr:major facilitator superfamily transporter [Xylariaceae sp. FL0804]
MFSIYNTWEKKAIVLGAAAGAFFSPFTAQIYYPALTQVAKDFHVSVTQVNLTITTYMIFQGLTPMFVGSFADVAGRRPAYLFCFVVYIAANIGCALAPNYAALLVLRMLQSAGASTTVALCQAVVADIITSAERGEYVSWTSVPVILAPSLGPVLGGIFSEYLGWRWIFWFLAIASSTVFILYIFFMPETSRAIVGDGSIRPHRFYRTGWQLIKEASHKRRAARQADADAASHVTPSGELAKQRFHLKRPNPLRTLLILTEPDMFIILSYSSLIYAGFYAVSAVLPEQLSRLYGFGQVKVGLTYLSVGGGSIIAASAIGRGLNWNYRRHCNKLNVPYDRKRQQDLAGFPIEKARLEVASPTIALLTLVLIGFGWALEYEAPLAVPIVLLFLVGATVVGASNCISTLTVDVYPSAAGAATAANNLTRCLVGAAATAAINPMISAIGAGWSFTIIALLCAVFSPALWLDMRNGVKWRKARAQKQQRRAERKQGVEEAGMEQNEPAPGGPGQEHKGDPEKDGESV